MGFFGFLRRKRAARIFKRLADADAAEPTRSLVENPDDEESLARETMRARSANAWQEPSERGPKRALSALALMMVEDLEDRFEREIARIRAGYVHAADPDVAAMKQKIEFLEGENHALRESVGALTEDQRRLQAALKIARRRGARAA